MGDWVGRRWGLIQDAIVMFVGLVLLTASWGTTLEGWVILYGWSLFFYSARAPQQPALLAPRKKKRGEY